MNWHETFNYDPLSGVLTFLPKPETTGVERRWNKLYANKPAGTLHATSNGASFRIRIALAKGAVYAHRVAWEITNGPIAKGLFVDHKDCDGTNNRLSNLRLATHAENCRNRRLRSDNKAGVKGVCWDGFSWLAQINVNGTPTKIGRYRTKEEAGLAYSEAAKRHHGQFARVK